VVDYDAKDVMEYAQRHPHDSDEEDVEIQDGRKREAEGEQSSSKKAVRFDETAADPGHEKSETSSSQALPTGAMVDDTPIEEPQAKVPRTSPPTSPTGSLYTPHFAGNVLQVQEQEEVDDEMWEKDVLEFMEGDEELQQGDQEPQDEGHPPTLTSEELEEVDRMAGFEEISRLLSMKVLREPSQEECEKGVPLSTRSVYDWRHHGGEWRRRC
jgi:hypothetical protein